MPDPTIMLVERALDGAMRLLMRAANRAESLRDQGLSDDLFDIARECARVLESLHN